MKLSASAAPALLAMVFAFATRAAFGHGDEQAQAAAIGEPGEPAKVDRTIQVTMDDTMRFHPDDIAVRPGETVRFLVHNEGRVRHEMMLGTMHELEEHAAMMRKMPGMKHTEPNIVSLAPGQQGRIVWKFPAAGTVNFACMEPGHMEAGMKGRVVVTPTRR